MTEQQLDSDVKNAQIADSNKSFLAYHSPKLDILNFNVTETAGTNIVESNNGFMS